MFFHAVFTYGPAFGTATLHACIMERPSGEIPLQCNVIGICTLLPNLFFATLFQNFIFFC